MIVLELTPEIFYIFGAGCLLLGIAVGIYFKIPTKSKKKNTEKYNPPTVFRIRED